MTEGSMLVIPPGNYLVTNLVFDLPDKCSILCLGTFISDSAGTIVTIGSEDATRTGYNIIDLKVQTSAAYNWETDGVGIDIVNVYGSYIDIREVTGYETNIRCRGADSKGTACNEIHLGKIRNGMESLALTADGTGWCNENTFYGGAFMFGSDLADFTNCAHIVVDDITEARLNNNHFIRPSLESSETTAKAVVASAGGQCSLYMPRFEGSTAVELGANAREWVIVSTFPFTLTDNGYQTKHWQPSKFMFKGSNDSGGVIVGYNRKGNAYSVLEALDFGENSVWNVNGVGQMTVGVAGTIIKAGSGSPESAVAAPIGSLFLRTNGGANTTLYVKESSTGSTGWVAK
jgi:hypothetical protein